MKYLKTFKIPAIDSFDRCRKLRPTELWTAIVERFTSETSNDNSVEGQAKAFRLWVLISGATLLVCALSSGPPKSEANSASSGVPSGDLPSQIPEGMLVVPIQAANYSALDPLLGNHAWADIYLPSLDGGRGARIGESIPIIRVPQNRQHLAVLLPEAESSALLSISDPVIVILRSSGRKKKDAKRPIAIHKNRSGKNQISPLRREAQGLLQLIEEPEITNETN